MVDNEYARTIPLSKTTKFIVDNRGRTAPTAECGIPLIATNCISNDRLYPAYENLRYVSQDTYDNWFRSHPLPGDIILTNKGSQNGAIALVPEPVDFVIAQDMVALRADETVIDPLFLFAALRSPSVQREIKNLDVSGVIPHFKKTDFDKLHLPYPDRSIQEQIGRTYFNFCAKIELNRRMNETLEAMARALFQSWFVDFDPVRAKLDGRKPVGLDDAAAALFPDHFDESRMGLIPRRWKATTLGAVCEEGGGSIQTGPFGTQLHASDYVPEGVPSIMPSDIRDNRISADSIARIREQDAERLSVYRVRAGDVVYSRRGDVERRSLIRADEEGWLCGTGCLRVRFGSCGLNPLFGAAYLGSAEARAWVVRHAVGATMPNLNTSILSALPIIVPPSEVQSRFAEIVGPLDGQGTALLRETETLSILRDALLPKLLSGSLNVQAIEQAVL